MGCSLKVPLSLLWVLALGLLVISVGVVAQECTNPAEPPCCGEFMFGRTSQKCVQKCTVHDDDTYEGCSEVKAAIDALEEATDYTSDKNFHGFNDLLNSRFDFNVESYNSSRDVIICNPGFRTDAGKDLYQCMSQCRPSDPEDSCVILRTDVCSGCEMSHVKDEPGWCNVGSGSCECQDGWVGDNCDLMDCEVGTSANGDFTQCVECPQGKYGLHCSSDCNCGASTKMRICHPVTGECECDAGYDVASGCREVCDDTHWGAGCVNQCTCKHGTRCNPVDGSCTCGRYLSGADCSTLIGSCPTNRYGPRCDTRCNCNPEFNCTREGDGNHCVCHETETRGPDCLLKLIPTTTQPTSKAPPITIGPGSPMQVDGKNPHEEHLTIAAIAAAGMAIGVALLFCCKILCCRGKYVRPPKHEGDVRVCVKEDTVYMSFKRGASAGSTSPGEYPFDPMAVIANAMIPLAAQTSMNGTAVGRGYGPHSPDAPNLHNQLLKNDLAPHTPTKVVPLPPTPLKTQPSVDQSKYPFGDVDKKQVQLPEPSKKGGKKQPAPTKAATINNEYAYAPCYSAMNEAPSRSGTMNYARVPVTPQSTVEHSGDRTPRLSTFSQHSSPSRVKSHEPDNYESSTIFEDRTDDRNQLYSAEPYDPHSSFEGTYLMNPNYARNDAAAAPARESDSLYLTQMPSDQVYSTNQGRLDLYSADDNYAQ